MDLTYRFVVPAGPDQTWNALNDLDALAPCFPGATLTESSGNTFTGSVKIKFGPLALVYTGGGRYRERDAGRRRVVVETSGTDHRGNGEARAVITARVVDPGAGSDASGTEVEVHTDLQLTGRPASFGEGVIRGAGQRLAEQFVSCIQPRFADGLGSTPPSGLGAGSTDDDHGIELGTSPEEIDGAAELGVATPAAPRRAAPTTPTAPQYTPPSNTAQPDFAVVATVTTRLVKRYWPVLAGLAAVGFVATKILGRKR